MHVNTRYINTPEDVPCTLCLCASLVRVTVGDSGLCCCGCVTCFEHWLTPLRVDSSRASFYFKMKQSKSTPLSPATVPLLTASTTAPPLPAPPLPPSPPPPGLFPISGHKVLFTLSLHNDHVERLSFIVWWVQWTLQHHGIVAPSSLTRKICIWLRGIDRKA